MDFFVYTRIWLHAQQRSSSKTMPVSPILIKRYARSRLYDPSRPRYVTVDELRDWERKGIIFTVLDVETGEDITRVLLA
jgi:polyhydroxyalkanoate synthesis regulator protein